MEGGPGGPGRWAVYLVDLPGYGYARGGADCGGGAGARSPQEYFTEARGAARRPTLAPRRLPASRACEADLDAVDVAGPAGRRRGQIVATKIDKLSRNERAKNLKALETTFGTAALPVSATSGEGMDELWRTIARLARTAE